MVGLDGSMLYRRCAAGATATCDVHLASSSAVLLHRMCGSQMQFKGQAAWLMAIVEHLVL